MGYVALGYAATLGGVAAYAGWLVVRSKRLTRERGR